MGILAEGVRRAFKEYRQTNNIFKFAREMVDLGDRCRYRNHRNSVDHEINKIYNDIPVHIPKVQSVKYLKAKGEKERGECVDKK